MKSKFDITALVDDLEPVTVLNARRPLMIAGAITVAIIAVIASLQGIRADLMAGRPDEMFLIRAGILLLLGGASAHAVASMASPSVGKSNNGWQIALAASVLFPLSALIVAASTGIGPAVTAMESGWNCVVYSAIGGLATAIPMVLVLRRGAPTSPARAGWLTGIASGGLGAFAYNLHCPFNDVVYIGFWYTLSVSICALAGRLIVPRIIRW